MLFHILTVRPRVTSPNLRQLSILVGEVGFEPTQRLSYLGYRSAHLTYRQAPLATRTLSPYSAVFDRLPQNLYIKLLGDRRSSLAVFCPFKTYSWHDVTSSLLGPANVGSGSTGTPTRELFHSLYLSYTATLTRRSSRQLYQSRPSSTISLR